MTSGLKSFYEFGRFRLDPATRRLLRDGRVVPLPPKAFDALLLLVRNAGEPIEREELLKAVWAGAFVEDANLTVAVSQLRKALGQEGGAGEYIETIPRVGYRFVAEVREVAEQPAPLIVERHTLSRTVIEEESVAENDVASEGEWAEGALSVAGSLDGAAPGVPESARRAGPKALDASGVGGEARRPRRRMLAVASAAVLGLLGLSVYVRVTSGPKLPSSSGEVKSMAVLPFRTPGAQPEDVYLGPGLADILITQLGRVRQVVIRPAGAVLEYVEAGGQDPLAAGRELGVDAVLEGSVQRAGEDLRVTVRLLRVGDGAVLWSGKFDERFTDIFSVQDSVSQQVAQALTLDLSREERALLTRRYTDDVEAYQNYLKGRYFWNKRTTEGIRRSLEYFGRAIELDPTYALAYAGLADSYALLVWRDGLPQQEFIPRAKAAAVRALEIDEALAEAHTSLGFVRFWYEWDFPGAEAEYRRAVELKPGYATAHHWYGEFLVLMGRFEEGLREMRLAQEADPLSPIIAADIGKMLFFARRPEEAVGQLRKTVELDPQFSYAHLFLAMAYNRLGRPEQAAAEVREWAAIPDSSSIFKAVLGYSYARAGRRAEALKVVDELKKHPPDRLFPSYKIALVHVGMGEKDQALAWLERGRAEHDPFLLHVKVDPNLDPLRAEPRFAELLKSMNLAE